MEYPVKCALITGFVSKTKDRFHEYNKSLTLAERLQLVAEMDGMSGVEVVFPYEASDASELSGLLKENNLEVAAINVNVKAEPEFRNGGITSTDPAIRSKAVQFIKNAKDFAQATGANKVTCCPLGDGYEFNFQCDYAQMWKYMVEAFEEAGAYKEEIPLFVEYKPSETRGHCFVDTAAKALCLLNDIGNKSMGITLDFGHSMYGQENPAEAVAMVAESDYNLYIHINDNDGKWDWDYPVCTRNFLAYVEFLFYLQKYNYTDFVTSDTSPTRWDIKETFEMNTRLTNKIWKLLSELDRKSFQSLISGGDYMKVWKFIEKEIFSL
ncbi:MAG: sugar phosphate isomerase/epimerase [Proteobacteria bacterium]|nr:sugar phosphate isomerase/epimerase [Pseudomonadota bacterium]